ncbi:hypothetical protein [Fontibacillus sp. BL9]
MLMWSYGKHAGEKERRTLESLPFAPIEVKDLFMGKLVEEASSYVR